MKELPAMAGCTCRPSRLPASNSQVARCSAVSRLVGAAGSGGRTRTERVTMRRSKAFRHRVDERWPRRFSLLFCLAIASGGLYRALLGVENASKSRHALLRRSQYFPLPQPARRNGTATTNKISARLCMPTHTPRRTKRFARWRRSRRRRLVRCPRRNSVRSL
jgi:hypothetical protein